MCLEHLSSVVHFCYHHICVVCFLYIFQTNNEIIIYIYIYTQTLLKVRSSALQKRTVQIHAPLITYWNRWSYSQLCYPFISGIVIFHILGTKTLIDNFWLDVLDQRVDVIQLVQSIIHFSLKYHEHVLLSRECGNELFLAQDSPIL